MSGEKLFGVYRVGGDLLHATVNDGKVMNESQAQVRCDKANEVAEKHDLEARYEIRPTGKTAK